MLVLNVILYMFVLFNFLCILLLGFVIIFYYCFYIQLLYSLWKSWAEDMGQFLYHLDPDKRKITKRLEKNFLKMFHRPQKNLLIYIYIYIYMKGIYMPIKNKQINIYELLLLYIQNLLYCCFLTILIWFGLTPLFNVISTSVIYLMPKPSSYKGSNSTLAGADKGFHTFPKGLSSKVNV